MEFINKLNIDKKFYVKLIAIALPITLQNLITASLNMIDVFMISSLGEISIAGVGVANRIFFLLMLLLFGTSSGTAIFASQYWGKKDIVNIKRILGICLIIGIAGSMIFTFAAILFPESIIRIFTPGVDVIREGSNYLRIIGISYVFTAITFSYVFILRSTNEVKLPVCVTIFSIGVNTFLNWVLIFGNLGAPALGVRGAAIATVFARILETIILLSIIYARKLPAAAKLKELFDFDRAYVINYFKTVLPVIINEVMWSTGVTMYSLVYGRMGHVVMASITITQTIEQLATVLFFGIASACAVMLGNELGANNLERANIYAIKFIKSIFLFAIIIGVAMFFLSSQIVHLFDVSDTVKNYIRLCLKVFSIYLPIKQLNLVIIIGILRSGGDSVFTMLIDTGAVWLVGVPLAFITGLVLKLELQYVYAFIMFEEFVKLFFGLFRTFSKKWIKNLVGF